MVLPTVLLAVRISFSILGSDFVSLLLPIVVKGIGIPILKQYGIMDKLQAAVENKKSINTRQGSLFAVQLH